jgi:hypothetical protein
MPAYDRGGLSAEAYAVRILAAVVKNAGGTLRIKGEDVDGITEDVFLSKTWCRQTQELVLQLTTGSFNEVFRVTAEKKPAKEVVTQPSAQEPTQEPVAKSASTLDNDRAAGIEEKIRQRLVRIMMKRPQPQA